MFEYCDPPKLTEPIDYTGLKVGLLVVPVFLLFVFLGDADMGLSVSIVLGLLILAIRLRWNLSKHVWFWATIAVVLALHTPLFFFVRWSHRNVATIAYTLPFGIADFLIMMGAIGLAEKLFQRRNE
jgi:hypothetical protein